VGGEKIGRAKHRLLWGWMGATLVMIGAVEAWAFSTHHAAVGVAVLIAVVVVPEFVVIPLRIRRARRSAEHSRARRRGSDPHST
jgi:hypothetical protein